MRKKIVSVAIVLLFTCLVVYAGAKAPVSDDKVLPDLETVLKEAKEDGYTVRKATRYDADDTAKDIHIVLYSEEQEVKSFSFDVMGNQTGYGLIKRDADGRIIMDIGYNSDDQVSSKRTYAYVGNNVITEHSYHYDYRGYYDDSGEYHTKCWGIYHEIYSYEYDDQGRKSFMWTGIGEDTTDDVDPGFYTSYFFYDEEGRLIREEFGEFGEAYIAYVYDGPLLLKEEVYWVADGANYCASVTEYEYDEEGRMLKWAEYEEDYYSGGAEYEYDEKGRMLKYTQFRGNHKPLQYWTYEYFD